jgi:6-pyruvoyltetrahydropterin/6-carboxytetrahydropterin synthase
MISSLARPIHLAAITEVFMRRMSTIELFKEEMKFSAGHFTIFSATERESLHGHNFNVHVSFTGQISPNGLVADYTILRDELISLCAQWDSIFIIPERSPFLKIETTASHVVVHYNQESFTLLKRDVLLLPIENATVEAFAELIVERLLKNSSYIEEMQISELTVKVFTSPGQCASVEWVRGESK